MRIGIIGYGNHAARIRELAARHPAIKQIVVFHPDASRIKDLAFSSTEAAVTATSDFDAVLECDAALICSPSDTHRTYLDRLQGRDVYVFCEKPIATAADDLDWLQNLPGAAKRKIYCNHNYAHTEFCRKAEELIDSGAVGSAVHLQAGATHGLSFNPAFADNWRFKTNDPFASIVGNLGIHYIHLALHLFDEPDQVVCHRSRVNPNSADADTCSILMQCARGQSVYIHLSYSEPYVNNARLMFTDGTLELDDGRLRLFSPRDSFDADGRFATPPHEEVCRFETSKAYYDQSLVRSLDTFLEVAASGQDFSEDSLGMAVKSAQLVQQMCAENDGIRDVF